MEDAIFVCPEAWRLLLPAGLRLIETASALETERWRVLALTSRGCREVRAAMCSTLLVPGEWAAELSGRVSAQTVITCGLSARDSLTLSSLEKPVLCVQRGLPRPDGGEVVPQEFPLPTLPGPPAELLVLLGLRLLQMQPGEDPFSW